MFTIGVQVEPALMENSHLMTEPVWPVKASVPELAPEQTVALDATDPPTEAALTVIIATAEFADAHEPF